MTWIYGLNIIITIFFVYLNSVCSLVIYILSSFQVIPHAHSIAEKLVNKEVFRYTYEMDLNLNSETVLLQMHTSEIAAYKFIVVSLYRSCFDSHQEFLQILNYWLIN